jgi:hypothetical protein
MIENNSIKGAPLTGSFKYPKMEAEPAYETSRFSYNSISPRKGDCLETGPMCFIKK